MDEQVSDELRSEAEIRSNNGLGLNTNGLVLYAIVYTLHCEVINIINYECILHITCLCTNWIHLLFDSI